MDNDSGCMGCLTATGAVLGILVSLITILKFFFTDGDEFITAVQDFMPAITSVIEDVNGVFFEFAQSGPIHPWWTAIVAIIIGAAVKYFLESEFFYDEFDIRLLPFWAIPALLWLFVFYGTVSIMGMIVFLVVYILVSFLVGFVLDEWL